VRLLSVGEQGRRPVPWSFAEAASRPSSTHGDNGGRRRRRQAA
jgi:hypothetical protein